MARMDGIVTPAGVGGMIPRVVRDTAGVQRYFGKLTNKIMQLAAARACVESLGMTGNPSEHDVELEMIARVERRDHYEAIRMGRYEPCPGLTSPESKAI